MLILVTAASRHGSTSEVADAIAQRLSGRGLSVDRVAPDAVQSLDGYDAVIVGSSIRMRRWADSAQRFIDRFSSQLQGMPVWGFSVGLSGVPKRAPQDPRRIGPVTSNRILRDHQTFAGKYSPSELPLRDRTVASLAGAVEGDYRDWDAINRWADAIADDLLGGEQL